ncbi:flavodoxin family protein [Desulfobulbus rhabdoformis]|jgi:multimeric flavodoxin WrbA|uniref:flavodoxin family protein n=1 Tax=Desulfobulbus rhabdoformis TaxID=34032 RepID=UPI0019627C3C|nr:flavodoxin family protein [Desulfobulbus rhabdoformis]MBM9613837.1 flavodoxin family protein [Desulfobulbus rhabdoformis]
MKVVAFNGSARKNGNTAMMINYMFEELHKEDIETELVQLSGEHPHGCIACYQCFKKKNGRCIVDVDCINSCVEKMTEADGIVLASPTYFADISTEMKALIDRCGMVSRANGDLYKRKVGAAIVTQRRGGGIHAFDSMNHFFTIGQMIIVGSSYWNIGFGREKGEVKNDTEAVTVMRDLGKNMGWLLKKING